MVDILYNDSWVALYVEGDLMWSLSLDIPFSPSDLSSILEAVLGDRVMPNKSVENWPPEVLHEDY